MRILRVGFRALGYRGLGLGKHSKSRCPLRDPRNLSSESRLGFGGAAASGKSCQVQLGAWNNP